MAENGMLSPQEIDALVAAKAQSPELGKVMKAVLKRESNYGQNPAAYVANKAGGVIGIGQIQSKQVGGKYNNFENYADAGQTDVNNPIHTANAALNMIADKWNKSKGNTQQFVNEYFGRAAKDKLGGTNIGYVQAINNALANGVTTPTGNSAFQGVTAGTVGIPPSALGAVEGYNKQLIAAAQKVADNNIASVNNFNWNPNTKDSSAQTFGKIVSNNTDALSQVYDTNMKEMQAFTNPTADTYLGRVGDKLGAMWNVSGNTLTERYLKRAEANQSATGKAVSDQVLNMQNAMKGTVIDPTTYDKAANNLQQQQQLDTQTYTAVANNLNTQEQHRILEAKVQAANNPAGSGSGSTDDATLVNAARSLGIQLPEGMKTSDIKATLGDKLAAVQAVAANNGSLGNDPYTAVQTVKLLGNAAPPELVKQAQIHENFQASVLASKGYKEIPVPLGASKEQAAMISAQNDNAKRVVINKAYQEAANNEGGLATLPGNPYTALGGATKTLANGLSVPKGIAPEEIGKLSAVDFISKASQAGASSVEIADFYKGLNTNATKDTNFKVFNAPAPSGKFIVQLKGVDDKMDLATPAGVERFKALIKSNQVKLDPTNTFFKFLSAGVDFFDPMAYISGNKTGQFGYNNNLVDQLTGTPQVTWNPK